MKILVTGVDGFLGQKIAKALKNDGHEVFGLSKGADPGGIDAFWHIDITRREDVLRVVSSISPDLCIHLAAMAHADVAPKRASLVRAVNVDGAFNVMDAIKKAGTKDIVYFSSAKVLGECTPIEGIGENTEACPVGFYADLKREVEVELLRRSDSEALNVVIIRPVAVIGPDDTKGNYAKMMAMVNRGIFPLLDGGRARRSVVSSYRVAERTAKMVAGGVKRGRCYLFSDGDFSVREIVDAMRSASGFAFCPSIPSAILQSLSPLADPVLSMLLGRPAPMASILRRLTDSFVVMPTNFDADYGALKPIDLVAEFRRVDSVSAEDKA